MRIEESGSRTEDREPKTEDRGPSIEGRDWNIEGRVVARAENRGSRIEDPGSRLECRRLDEFGQVWREPRGRVRNGCGRNGRSEIPPRQTISRQVQRESPRRVQNGCGRNTRGGTGVAGTRVATPPFRRQVRDTSSGVPGASSERTWLQRTAGTGSPGAPGIREAFEGPPRRPIDLASGVLGNIQGQPPHVPNLWALLGCLLGALLKPQENPERASRGPQGDPGGDITRGLESYTPLGPVGVL